MFGVLVTYKICPCDASSPFRCAEKHGDTSTDVTFICISGNNVVLLLLLPLLRLAPSLATTLLSGPYMLPMHPDSCFPAVLFDLHILSHSCVTCFRMLRWLLLVSPNGFTTLDLHSCGWQLALALAHGREPDATALGARHPHVGTLRDRPR